MRQDMQRLLEDVEPSASREFPSIDLWSGESGLVFHATLPGFDPKEIDVSVVGDTLTLRAARAPSELSKGATLHRRERAGGKFVRTIQLPYAVERDQVKATYENGILEVELPRSAADKPRRVEVTTR